MGTCEVVHCRPVCATRASVHASVHECVLYVHANLPHICVHTCMHNCKWLIRGGNGLVSNTWEIS